MQKIICRKCGTKLSLTSNKELTCPTCKNRIKLTLFPSFYSQEKSEQKVSDITNTEDASCFFHANKKANFICQQCGRFICNLCNVGTKTKPLCSACFNENLTQKKKVEYESSRILWDDIALVLAFWPIFTISFTLITAPAAFFMVIFTWKKKTSIVPRSVTRKILALVLSSTQIFLWFLLFYFVINNQTGNL